MSSALIHTEASTRTVVEALKSRYDRNKLVYKHHVKELLALSPISDDHDSYERLKHSITKYIGGLKSCGGDSFEQFVAALLERLLPRSAAVLWADFSSKSDRPPTLGTFTDFLDRRLETTETLSSINRQPAYNHKSKPRSRVLHLQENRSETCAACDSSHTIYQCSTFKGWSLDKRNSQARKKHLCFNCLRRNHS